MNNMKTIILFLAMLGLTSPAFAQIQWQYLSNGNCKTWAASQHTTLDPAGSTSTDQAGNQYRINNMFDPASGIQKLPVAAKNWITLTDQGFSKQMDMIIAIALDGTGTLYTATNMGIYSFNQTKNIWLLANLPPSSNHYLFFLDKHTKTLYFIEDNGLYKLNPGNTTWILIDGLSGINSYYYSVGVRPLLLSMAVTANGKFCIIMKGYKEDTFIQR